MNDARSPAHQRMPRPAAAGRRWPGRRQGQVAPLVRRGRDRQWAILSFGVAVLLVIVDTVTSGGLVLTGLLVIAPVLASARSGPKATALVAAGTVLLALLDGFPNDFFGTMDHLSRVLVVVCGGALAVWIASLRRGAEYAEVALGSSRDQFQVILEGVADAVTAQDPSGRLVYANQAAVRSLGFNSTDELLNAGPEEIAERFEVFDEDGRPLEWDGLPARKALAGEQPDPVQVRYRDRRTGEERWSVVKSTPIVDHRGNVALAINIIEDLTEHKQVELHQRFLSDAGRVLSESLDFQATLQQVARLAVPVIADWCTVDVLSETGELEHVGLAAADPRKLDLARQLRREYPLDLEGTTGTAQVLRTGEPEVYPRITDELMVQAAEDERHLELLRGLKARSALTVPLIARGRAIGALTLVASESGRRLGESDLPLAAELARRAAIAVDNARLYTERSYIARALQQSLLPPELPDIPGMELAARFHAAGEGNEVGGDFYDVFDLGTSRWAVVMGDVCGKGPDAAAITALARYTLRAAAMREPKPSVVLTMLNEAMLRQRPDDERFATVAFGGLEFNGDGAQLTLASGGHPLPMVLRSSGEVGPVGGAGTVLGVVTDPELMDDTVALGPGDAVVLYTDGLTEAQAPERLLGTRELAELLERCTGQDAEDIADCVQEAALEGMEPRDDIAVLVLKVRD